MNEQIEALMIKASNGSCYDGPGEAQLFGDDIKKFAELIIAKCIEEAGDPADGLIKGDTWHDGVRASIWSIKQYFGVK